jgi:hypothetical protein
LYTFKFQILNFIMDKKVIAGKKAAGGTSVERKPRSASKGKADSGAAAKR